MQRCKDIETQTAEPFFRDVLVLTLSISIKLSLHLVLSSTHSG